MKIEHAIKQSSFTSSYQKMLINLMFTGNWLRDEQMKIFKQHDLLPQHFNVLRIIRGSMPRPIAPKDIKAVLIDKVGDLTRLLDKLEKKGLVQRNLCPSNRRKMDISITSKGLEFLDQLNQPLDDFTKKIQKNITESQAETLSNLLDTLRG